MGEEQRRTLEESGLLEEPDLQERERRLRQLVANIREVVWLTDWVSNRLLYVSPSYERIWGRSCESLHAAPGSWAAAIHPEDRERVYAAFRERAERGEYEEEYRIVRPDGSEHWIYDRAFPIRDADGRTVRLAGISEDITLRKLAEQELLRSRDVLEASVVERTSVLERTAQRLADEAREREVAERRLIESEGRFRQLAETIEEVFWLTVSDFSTVLYVSPAYERVWGRPAAELLADPTQWMQAIVAEDKARVEEAFYGGVLAGRYDVEYRIRRPDGELRWIHDRGFVVREGEGEVERIAGLALDITRKKEAEAELATQRERLRALAEELVQAEERERRRLAVDLHDGLNQSTTLALMKLEALAERVPEALAAEVEELRAIVRQADRVARSLTFQLSPPVLFDFGLEAGVQWLAEEVERTHGFGVEVLAPDAPLALEERLCVSLYRAARELLINVAKHAQASRATVRIERADGELAVEVADDGRSFEGDPKELAGFGLFSIRERLELFGGRMELHPRPGVGTRVRLVVPLGAE